MPFQRVLVSKWMPIKVKTWPEFELYSLILLFSLLTANATCRFAFICHKWCYYTKMGPFYMTVYNLCKLPYIWVFWVVFVLHSVKKEPFCQVSFFPANLKTKKRLKWFWLIHSYLLWVFELRILGSFSSSSQIELISFHKLKSSQSSF